MTAVKIRRAQRADAFELAVPGAMLWPDRSLKEHRRDADKKNARVRARTLPVALFVAEDDPGE
jgi:hypothetical protein